MCALVKWPQHVGVGVGVCVCDGGGGGGGGVICGVVVAVVVEDGVVASVGVVELAPHASVNVLRCRGLLTS